MISKENIEKLNLNGLYRHAPVATWRSAIFQDNLYHCCNWTFRPVKAYDRYYMADTYFKTNPTLFVELTDEIFNEFELIFDLDDVKDWKECPSVREMYDPEDWYLVPVDSGGLTHAHYFLKKDAKPSYQVQLAHLETELKNAERKCQWIREDIQRLKEKYQVNS